MIDAGHGESGLLLHGSEGGGDDVFRADGVVDEALLSLGNAPLPIAHVPFERVTEGAAGNQLREQAVALVEGLDQIGDGEPLEPRIARGHRRELPRRFCEFHREQDFLCVVELPVHAPFPKIAAGDDRLAVVVPTGFLAADLLRLYEAQSQQAKKKPPCGGFCVTTESGSLPRDPFAFAPITAPFMLVESKLLVPTPMPIVLMDDNARFMRIVVGLVRMPANLSLADNGRGCAHR